MDRNAAVQDLIDAQVADGAQIGCQVAAYLHGEKIIDVAAGTRGPGDDRPVERDSLFLSFSCTKGPSSTVVQQLVDRGVIDNEAPVATYWPEFAQNGKGEITIAQAMSHQAGLHALPPDLRKQDLLDWDAGLAWVAGGKPAWVPGTATGYHAVTFGWIVGGIVQGATGRQMSEVMRTEIAEPLGVADEFFLGLPDEPGLVDRLTTLELVPAGDGLPIPDDAPFYEAMPKSLWQHFNDMDVRMACMPGANGHFTARALAKMYGALANGGAPLVSSRAIAEMQRLRSDSVDRVLMAPIRRSVGFTLGGVGPDPQGNVIHGLLGPRESAFGHGGAGGSVGFADPELGLGVAVTRNKMTYPAPGRGATQEICDLVRSLV